MSNRAPIIRLKQSTNQCVTEVETEGSDAESTGTCAGGESQRAGGASASENGVGKLGARGGAGDAAGSPDRQATGVGWSRQRIRRAGVCGRYARSEGGAARGPKRTATCGAPSMSAQRGSWVMR